ncbi:MAG: hypothetical protein NVS3B16_08950 [Vulcanimicrobiaceae bacterium]
MNESSRRRVVAALVTLLALPVTVAPAGAAPEAAAATSATYERLQSLARDMTYESAKRHPLGATDLGLTQYDGLVETPSAAANAADLALARQWRARLETLQRGATTLVERDDARLLRARLTRMEREYTTYRSYDKSYAAPAQAIVGAIFTQFQHLPIVGNGGATAADGETAWDHVIARLEAAPVYIAAAQALVAHPGHLQGVVGAEQLAGAPDFFNGALTAAAKTQLPAERFARFERARDATLRTIAATKSYIDAHVAAWPENYAMGRAAYDAMLADEQLLPFNGADVERMAHDELAHGWAVQTWVEDAARQQRTPIGPQSGGGLAPGGPALVGYYRDRIAQLQDFVTTHRVVDVPPWLGKIEVVETPKFLQPVSPGASMNAPLLFGTGSTGFYFITPPTSLEDAAKRLDPNQDFDRDRILSTGAHEAMPGHFMQLSIARRHPDFVRKTSDSGVFAEGWAFYGEELFVSLGLYGDNLDARFYTAQWERVRGARAIVDPALASGTMKVAEAADFFAKQTGFSPEQAKAAISGIALNPGYVISYTVGRYQLEELLADYRARTGPTGSLLDFHDRLLSYGTTPFAVVGPELLADLALPLASVRAHANY